MKRWPLEALFAGSGGVAFPRMTALVGAGGKTTLMYALARRMADAGRRVVCTTTTKIFPPEDGLPVVLLEGAARKPLKAPAAHEPVLPEPLDCCVAVVGLDSVGQPLDDGHVHRSALVCAAAGQEPGSPVTPATLACLVEHPEGLFRNCPAGCRRLVFANKGDGPGALDAASEAAALSRSVAWFAGSAAQGWCVPLTAGAQRALGMEPFRDLPC